MQLFKEESNRRFRDKEAELGRLQAENAHLTRDLRDGNVRISSSEKSRQDVEARARQLEDELALLRNQIAALKRSTDEEIGKLRQELMELRDAYRRKELAYNEIMGVKIHLDAQYRKLLDVGETEAEGYESPLLHSPRKRARRTGASPFSSTSRGGLFGASSSANGGGSMSGSSGAGGGGGGRAGSSSSYSFSSTTRVSGSANGGGTRLRLGSVDIADHDLPLDIVSVDTSAGFFEVGNTSDGAVTLRNRAVPWRKPDEKFPAGDFWPTLSADDGHADDFFDTSKCDD